MARRPFPEPSGRAPLRMILVRSGVAGDGSLEDAIHPHHRLRCDYVELQPDANVRRITQAPRRNPMSGVLVFLGTILFVLATAFSLYVRWWLGRAVNETPQIEVQVDSDDDATRIILTTRGTRRQFRLRRITAPNIADDDVVGPPDKFREVERGERAVSWAPRRPVILPPGLPYELRITHQPGDSIMLRGDAESKLGVGGTSVQFSILVRERDPERRDLFNRRSALYAAAAERGVAPRKLPEWRKIRALEERLGESPTPKDQPDD